MPDFPPWNTRPSGSTAGEEDPRSASVRLSWSQVEGAKYCSKVNEEDSSSTPSLSS